MRIENLESYLKVLTDKLGSDADVVAKPIFAGKKKIGIVYLKSMIDEQLYISGILTPIRETKETEISISALKDEILKSADISEVQTEEEVIEKVFEDAVIILIEGEDKGLAVDIEQFPVRPPAEPPTSAVIMGPREGFVEHMKTNITLLRRKLQSPMFKIEEIKVGRKTNTRIAVCYMSDIADKDIVKKVKERLGKIDIDGVLDSHYLISFISDRPNSMFKQIGVSEKPDIVAAKLLEGRVAIMLDGSPIILTVPFMVIEDLQNSNDYYTNSHYVSFIRAIRALGIIVATVVPGVYIALRLYHYKIMPIQFIITISSSTQSLPYSPVIEIVFILVMFLILYEVSLRLPRYLGLATSIVGALILGDTGVKAGLISPPGVIIIAMSVISIYVVPDEASQLTLLRAIFIVLGAALGLLGVVAGMMFFINHMAIITSYGAPYLAPYAPKIKADMHDATKKIPVSMAYNRPEALRSKNKVKLKK